MVRTAYFKLKKAVFVIDPERVLITEKLHELHKSKRKLIKEINQEIKKVNGKINDELISSNRREIANLNKLIKSLEKQSFFIVPDPLSFKNFLL